MSNILLAKKGNIFGWFYAWQKLNAENVPDVNIESALKQPETKKIKWEIPGTRGDRPQEVSADIVPNKGVL